MKQQLNYKMILVIAIMLFFGSTSMMAQVPPSGKYNTTNYPDDRKAIEALGMLADSSAYLNDDYIFVGAEGRVYYGRMEEYKKSLQKN